MTPYKQRGLGLIGWSMLIVAVGFVLLTTAKLVPAYISNHTVRDCLEQVVNDSPIRKGFSAMQSQVAIKNSLRKRLNMNDIDVVNLNDDLEFTREDGGVMVDVYYEVRKPLMGNIDVVLSFEESVLVPYQ